MEHTLKCNRLKCRKELGDRALVTTCSHIFCLECARQSGMVAEAADAARRTTCLACNGALSNPDDAVITVLNPSEDYKTSVLSGLGPNIVMECAGRALSFWAYQTTQEIVYQRYLEKNLTDKYKSLDSEHEKTVNEANSAIEKLQGQMRDTRAECDDMRRKYDELAQAYREKGRKLLQTQELYDRVKRKAELGQMQAAASHEIDSQLGGPSFERPSPQGLDGQGFFEQQESIGARGRSFEGHINPPAMPPSVSRGVPLFAGAEGTWRRPNVSNNGLGVVETPMRQRVTPGLTGLPRVTASTPLPLHGASRLREFARPSPGLLPSPNRQVGLGAGMSAIKVGHPDAGGSGRPPMAGPTFGRRTNML